LTLKKEYCKKEGKRYEVRENERVREKKVKEMNK
jgi:hypothetical protein